MDEIEKHCGKMDVEELVARMQEFDPDDEYHQADGFDPHDAGYHHAVDRCIALLRGEISVWTDPPKAKS